MIASEVTALRCSELASWMGRWPSCSPSTCATVMHDPWLKAAYAPARSNHHGGACGTAEDRRLQYTARHTEVPGTISLCVAAAMLRAMQQRPTRHAAAPAPTIACSSRDSSARVESHAAYHADVQHAGPRSLAWLVTL